MGKPPVYHLLLILLTLSWAGTGLASDAGVPEGATLPWADKSKYKECGNDCLYKRANEQLAYQALYVMQKIDLLRDTPDTGLINRELAHFCLSGEAAFACRDRYVRQQTMTLESIQQGLIQHSDTIAQLDSKFVQKNDVPVFVREQDPKAGEKKPVTPYVQSFKDLEKQYKWQRKNKPKAISQQSYDDWVKQLKNLEPKEEDFYKFKMVSRDPNNPSSEKIRVYETDSNGYPVPDKPAYDKAKERWKEFVQKDLAVLKSMKPNLAVSDELDDQMAPTKSKEFLNNARGLMVEKTNELVSETGLGSGRKPAGDKKSGMVNKTDIKSASHVETVELIEVKPESGNKESNVNLDMDPRILDEYFK